jgi:REP element-mobilizing transposase RayT
MDDRPVGCFWGGGGRGVGVGGSSGGDRRQRRVAAHRLYAQIAWPTLGGMPFLDRRRAVALERELIALCRRLDVEPLEVKASPDRVQLLVRFGPGQTLLDVAKRLKEASGTVMRRWSWPARWGRGFAACTVGPSQVHRLIRRLRAERVLAADSPEPPRSRAGRATRIEPPSDRGPTRALRTTRAAFRRG